MVSKSWDILGHSMHFVGPKVSAFIIEFIGTFFLNLTIGFNVVQNNSFGPIAIGSILMVMIFMGGHISGAHYNPAVTLGVRLTGRDHISTSSAFIYLIVQLTASFFASLFVYSITDTTFAPAPAEGVTQFKALCVEFIYTFALVSVMLNSATTKSQNSNSFFGLAIGFTVLSAAYSVGNYSGGAFNPSVGFGPILVNVMFGSGTFKYIWIYWVGPLSAAIFAAMVFRITNTAEYRRAAAVATGTLKKDKDGYQPVNQTEGEGEDTM